MALAKAAAVSVATTSWTDVVTFTGDGTKQVIGASRSTARTPRPRSGPASCTTAPRYGRR